MAVFAGATAAMMYVFKTLIDTAGAFGEQSGLEATQSYAKLILPVLIGVAVLTGGSDFFQRVLSNALALNTSAKLQKQMLTAAHARDYASFAKAPSGELISRFTFDIKVVSDALIRVLSNLVKDSLTVIFTLAGMLYYNWQLTLVLAVLLLAMWPIIAISKQLRGSAAQVQAHTGKLTADLKQSFTGARLIKTYGLEAYENKRLGKEFDTRITLFLKLVTQQAWVEPILTLFAGLAISGIFIFGFWQVNMDLASAGSVVAVLTGVMILSPRLRALGTLNNAAQEGLAALSRIFSVIDEAPHIVNANDARLFTQDIPPEIAFENVSFAYDAQAAPALNGITFKASAGQMTALVGPSGGGKSTIMALLTRLYEPIAGSLKIGGANIDRFTLESLRANIAIVSQEVTLFNDTIAANIGLGDLNASREDIENAARAANAHDFISELPQGYDTLLGEDGAGLSGGQKQRLSIARAVLRKAPILLLDEATSALDAHSERKVQDALERLSDGRTRIVIAHKLSTIRKADYIYVIDNGHIIESGTYAQLCKKRGGAFKTLRDLQQD